MRLAGFWPPFTSAWGLGWEGVQALGRYPRQCVPPTLVSLVACTWSPEIWVTPHQVKARGPGLEKTGVAVNKPAEFTVDAKHGGKAPLRVQVQVRCPPMAESRGA